MIADLNSECARIQDKNGDLHCYIDNINFRASWGLFVGTEDNLFVAENRTCIVKKIQCRV